MSQDAVHTTARLYLCTDARQDRGDFADFVDAAFAGGVDIIQLRDKSLEAAEELELLEVLHAGGPPARPALGRQRPGGPRLAVRGSGVPHRAEGHPPRGCAGVPRQGHRDRSLHPQPGPGGRGHRRLPRPQRPGLLLRRAGVGHPHQAGARRRRTRAGALRGRRGPPGSPSRTRGRSRARCRGSRSAALTSEMWSRWWRPGRAGSWWSAPSPKPTILQTPPGPCSRPSTPPRELSARGTGPGPGCPVSRPARAGSSGASGSPPVPPSARGPVPWTGPRPRRSGRRRTRAQNSPAAPGSVLPRAGAGPTAPAATPAAGRRRGLS